MPATDSTGPPAALPEDGSPVFWKRVGDKWLRSKLARSALMAPLKNLTGVRGVAALWVVLYHFQATTLVVSSLSLGSVIGGGACGVDVFFVLSGLILSITYAPRFAAQGFTRRVFR